jgi:hypothetical protein
MPEPQDPFASPTGPTGPRPAGGPPPQGQPYERAPWGSEPTAYGAPTRRNGLGTAALVLGVIAVVTSITIVGGVVLGLLALVLGVIGRRRANRREADNGGVALAGAVLGGVALVLSIAFVAVGIALFRSGTGQSLVDCLDKAGNDQTAVNACEQQFRHDLGG